MLSERLASARTLLQGTSQDLGDVLEKAALAAFMSSDEAKSQFRIRGDQVAHHDLTKPQFISIVARPHTLFQLIYVSCFPLTNPDERLLLDFQPLANFLILLRLRFPQYQLLSTPIHLQPIFVLPVLSL